MSGGFGSARDFDDSDNDDSSGAANIMFELSYPLNYAPRCKRVSRRYSSGYIQRSLTPPTSTYRGRRSIRGGRMIMLRRSSLQQSGWERYTWSLRGLTSQQRSSRFMRRGRHFGGRETVPRRGRYDNRIRTGNRRFCYHVHQPIAVHGLPASPVCPSEIDSTLRDIPSTYRGPTNNNRMARTVIQSSMSSFAATNIYNPSTSGQTLSTVRGSPESSSDIMADELSHSEDTDSSGEDDILEQGQWSLPNILWPNLPEHWHPLPPISFFQPIARPKSNPNLDSLLRYVVRGGTRINGLVFPMLPSPSTSFSSDSESDP